MLPEQKKKRQMALGSIISFKITGIYVHFQGLYDLTGGYPHVSFARKKNTHTTYGCFWLPMKRHRACECRPLFRDYHRMPSADNFRMDSNRYPEGRLSPCFCFSHMSGPTPGWAAVSCQAHASVEDSIRAAAAQGTWSLWWRGGRTGVRPGPCISNMSGAYRR